jgi:putative transcriptional regulator
MSRVVAVPFGALLGALVLIALLAPPGSPAPRRSLAGQFLVASERLESSPFARTVVYLVRHDADGAYGLVINRPGPELPLAPLLRQLGLDDRGVTGRIRTHGGGPVEIGHWAVLHSGEYTIQGTERLAPDVALTSEPAVLADIAHGTGPRRYRLLLGYAGWRGGQLEDEIDAGAWITVPADLDILFDDDYPTKWERATARRRLSI